MNKNLQTSPPTTTGAESAEEIIGILTAISVVSKRLAKRLTLLEQQSAEKEGVSANGKTAAVPINAN